MKLDHWLAVGHVSEAARKALDSVGCMVRDVSRETPAIAIVYFPHSSDTLTIDFDGNSDTAEVEGLGPNETYIWIEGNTFHQPHFIWRSTWGDTPAYKSSITETELITFEEWERQRALTARKAIVEASPVQGLVPMK